MKQEVLKVIVWQNGMVMAFDRSGKQVPEYQGREEDVLPKIKRDFPDVVIDRGSWSNRVRDTLL